MAERAGTFDRKSKAYKHSGLWLGGRIEVSDIKPSEGYLDGERLTGRLTLRQARPGERFTPLGMQGSKLLSDYYTDRKMTRNARRTPILADEAGPVFIPGGTVADRVKIKDGTKRILHIIFMKGEESHEEMGR